ncbi:hypothetical protein C7M84_015414 [Penaeus vannamei]|uniref:Uncharacterized protein n=1 Tax=Penaeus vannamei TaxID=6689 RepID=A0A423SQW0_PENVA|nr:hypothetical protein C7M84_015414 [Penaeus vannamei]
MWTGLFGPSLCGRWSAIKPRVVGAPCWCLPGPVQAGGVPEGGCFMSGVVVVGFGSNPYPFKNPGVGGLCATPPTPGVGGGILHPCAEGPAVPGSPQAPTPPSPLAPTPGPPLLPLQRAAHDSAGPLGAFVHPSLSNRARAGGTPPRGGGWGGAGQLPARGPAAGPTCAPTPPAPLPAPVSPTPPYSTRLHPSAPEPQGGWVRAGRAAVAAGGGTGGGAAERARGPVARRRGWACGGRARGPRGGARAAARGGWACASAAAVACGAVRASARGAARRRRRRWSVGEGARGGGAPRWGGGAGGGWRARRAGRGVKKGPAAASRRRRSGRRRRPLRAQPTLLPPPAPVGWVGDRGRALRPVARWPRARWLGAFRTPGLPSRPARCAGEARAAARPYSTPATPLALHPFSASRAPVVHPAPSLHPPPLLPSTPSAAAQGPAVPCRVRATSDARGADPLPLSALCASRTHCPSPLPLRPRPSDPGRSAAGCARPRPYPPLQPAASPPRRRVTALRRPHPLATPSEPAHPACHPVRPVRYCEKREDRLAGELFMRQSGRFRVEGGRDREGSRRAASESQAARAARRSLCCFGPGFRCCCVRLWCNARGRAFAVSESRLLPGGCMMAQLCGMVVYAY